jgi:hypothetical protein
MHLAVKRLSTQQNAGNQKLFFFLGGGGAACLNPGIFRRSLGTGRKMRREKHIFGHGVMEQVAVPKFTLSLAVAASLLLVFSFSLFSLGNGLVHISTIISVEVS